MKVSMTGAKISSGLVFGASLGVLTLRFCVAQAQSEATQVTGVVFEDKNLNGILDPGEPGIQNVVVSNQRDAVQTDRDGRYFLHIGEATIIFISKPAGYEIPLNEANLPQFYYIHQPKGSPPGLNYDGIEPSGALPESIDFPLTKSDIKDSFLAIVTGDPQLTNETELYYFQEDIISQMKGTPAEFYLALGDIANDALNLYAPYNRLTAQLAMPTYNVPGNHDMNLAAPSDSLATETFKRVYGPTDFSFNYGKVHFVILDNVQYSGWNHEAQVGGDHRGYLSRKQLQWLRNDLAFVPEDHLIVLGMHIPIASEIQPEHKIENRDELFDILKFREHLLAVYGHSHTIEHLNFTEEMAWLGTAPFPGISVGASCGAWWGGPKDERGIPESFGLDGAPNGYFVFSFDQNRYNYHFYPANQPAEHQMRIISPQGSVPADSLGKETIGVNVFNGSPTTTVMYSLADDRFRRMTRTIMMDPSMVDLWQQNKETFPSWIEEVSPSSHIWTAPMPTDLTPGHYTLKVRAVDRLGNIFTGEQAIIIE